MIEILERYGLILLIGQYPLGPIGGLAMTLILAASTLILTLPLAILIGIARTSPLHWLSNLAAIYVNTIRGLPLLLVIFWAYFAVPLLAGKGISPFTTMLCALVAYETAYLGEVVRAGITALPKGQTEASKALGLSYWAMIQKVILPQALFNMIPSILNQFVVVVKNTSLSYIIGVDELTNAAYQINGQLLTKPFEVYALLAITYFCVCALLTAGVDRITKIAKFKPIAEKANLQQD